MSVSKWAKGLHSRVKSRFHITGRQEQLDDVYTLAEEIASGDSTVVKKAVHKKTGIAYAVKIFYKDLLTIEEKENLKTEVDILQRFYGSPHLVQLHECFETPRKFYMVMELLEGGELLARIRDCRCFTEKRAAVVVGCILKGLHHLHSNGVVHRDIKAENIIFGSNDDDTSLKIADFGFAQYIKDGETLRTACGSLAYVAPEIVKEQQYGKSVDMWSLGILTYIMLCGFPPFYDSNTEKMLRKIEKAELIFPSAYWKTVSSDAIDFVRKLLCLDPGLRMTAQQALSHKWIIDSSISVASQPSASSQETLATNTSSSPPPTQELPPPMLASSPEQSGITTTQITLTIPSTPPPASIVATTDSASSPELVRASPITPSRTPAKLITAEADTVNTLSENPTSPEAADKSSSPSPSASPAPPTHHTPTKSKSRCTIL